MLLAIDIGNSNIVLGGIDEGAIVFEARIATDHIKTSDQYGMEIRNMLEFFHVDLDTVEDCIISSVVPPVFNAVHTGIIKLTGRKPMVVGPGIKTGLNIHMDDPASVGSDRIVIAVAALQEYETPLALVDMGTATTIEIVDHDNTYLRGCRVFSWISPSASLAKTLWSVCAAASCTAPPPCWTACWTAWRRNWESP